MEKLGWSNFSPPTGEKTLTTVVEVPMICGRMDPAPLTLQQ